MRNYPRKRFGQHFLVDKNVILKIVSAAGVEKGDTILEVGPGRGALTEIFLDKGARVLTIEIDRDLSKALKKRFSGNPDFELVEADVLKVSFVELAGRYGCKFKVVSNLPYNISGPVVVKFLEQRRAFSSLTLMLQKEVALRLTATPATKDYGALTVLTRAYVDAKVEFDVQPGSFFPAPKVTSTVISMQVLEKSRLIDVEKGDMDEVFFKKVVKSAFAQRRKTLANSMKTLGLPPDVITGARVSTGSDPKKRGETLSLLDFIALTRELRTSVKNPHT